MAEALRLADWLEDQYDPTYNQEQAAAELRRLARVEAQRDALLEVLKMLVLATKEVSVGRYNEEAHDIALSKALAAIKAVEGENHAKSL